MTDKHELDDYEEFVDSGLSFMFRNIKPMPTEVKEAYKNDVFVCSCGGQIIPQTMKTGICFQCQETVNLSECEYEDNNE
jgi:hypothetical protein